MENTVVLTSKVETTFPCGIKYTCMNYEVGDIHLMKTVWEYPDRIENHLDFSQKKEKYFELINLHSEPARKALIEIMNFENGH